MSAKKNNSNNQDKFEIEKIVDTNRVAKVVKGGRNFSFSAMMVVGNKAGKVGIGTGKANGIVYAIRKSKKFASKNMVSVNIINGTIPHEVVGKHSASKILLFPASPGTGIIAGGPARAILEAAGIENILTKSIGSNTPANVAKATLNGLKKLRTIYEVAKLRGKKVSELTGQEKNDETAG